MAIAALGSPTAPSGVDGVSSLTFAHNQTAGTDVILVVNVQARDTTVAGDRVISSVTYNGAAMTSAIQTDGGAGSNDMRSASFYKQNPTTGSSVNVVVTMAGTVNWILAGAQGFSGAEVSASPVHATNTANLGTGSVSIDLVSTISDTMVICSAGHLSNFSFYTGHGSGQNPIHESGSTTLTDSGVSSYKAAPSATTTTMTHSWSTGSAWNAVAWAIKPSAAADAPADLAGRYTAAPRVHEIFRDNDLFLEVNV